MSVWRDARNEAALARLRRTMPDIFLPAVLAHALARPFVPPTPRRAVESYWRAHPLRADRLARGLARLSGTPDGWRWSGQPFRLPPAPYREAAFARGPGHCCVCGQPVFRFGWHRDLWDAAKPNRNATWHTACVVAWKLWCQPTAYDQAIRRHQNRRCLETGKRLLRTAEIDHRVPLFQVRRDHRDLPWPDLLTFWGIDNLGAVNRDAHRAKCGREADDRAIRRRTARAVLSPP